MVAEREPESPDDATVVRPDGEATARMDARVARRVANRYELLERLGQGGFGSVFRARDTLLQRDVAVKLLDREISKEQRERFLREARATARLDHPNIVTIFDAGDDPLGLYLVLELIGGVSLRQVIGQVTPAKAREIVRDVAGALAAAHERGIVHRDIKPANILLMHEGRAVVADFGVAYVAGDARLTVDGGSVGTPTYMAPEQVDGREVGAAADLFALGSVAYELLTGKPPFRGGGMTEVMAKIARASWEPLPETLEAEAGLLAPLIGRLLQKDPSRRPSAQDVVALLSAADGAHGRPVRSRARAAVLVSVVLAVLVGALAWVAPRWRRDSESKVPRTASRRVELSRASAADVLEKLRGPETTAGSGHLAGIPVRLRAAGPRGVEIHAAVADLDRAAQCVRIVDELAGYRFADEPNLFTGSAAASRKIGVSGTYQAGDLLSLIASSAGLPIVLDVSVQRSAPISLELPPTEWDRVVNALLERTRLSAERLGNLWLIETPARREERHQREAAVLSIRIRRADLDGVAASVRSVLTTHGVVVPWPRTRSLILWDVRDGLDRARTVLRQLDGGPELTPRSGMTFAGQPVSLGLRNAELTEVIKMIGKISGLALVIDPAIRGTVDAEFKDVPWDNFLEAICLAHRVYYRVEGDIMHVAPEKQIQDTRITAQSLLLIHDEPSAYLAFAKVLPRLQIVADDPSNTLILRGETYRVRSWARIFQQIDAERSR